MDKTGWALFLCLQLLGGASGLVGALLPPWTGHENFVAIVNGVQYGFLSVAGFLTLFAAFHLVTNLWPMIRGKETEEFFLEKGLERNILWVYVLTFVLVLVVSRWFLLLGFLLTSFMMFVRFVHLHGKERRARELEERKYLAELYRTKR